MFFTPGLIFHCFGQLDGSSSFFLLDSKFSIFLLKENFLLKSDVEDCTPISRLNFFCGSLSLIYLELDHCNIKQYWPVSLVFTSPLCTDICVVDL